MKITKLLSIFGGVMLALSFCKTSADAYASTCDYIDEDGYCVTIVDNSNNIPVIGEDENYLEDVIVDTPMIDEEIDDTSNGIGNIEKEEEEKYNIYLKEYESIANSSTWIIGDKDAYINARFAGYSYSEAYRMSFSPDFGLAMEEIVNNIKENKDFIQSFFDQIGTESFQQTVGKLWESVTGLFK